jgi:hypothetical protein
MPVLVVPRIHKKAHMGSPDRRFTFKKIYITSRIKAAGRDWPSRLFHAKKEK